MKNIFIFFYFFIFLFPALKGQDVIVKVLGSFSYVEKAETNGAIITFSENTNKCDPAIGFISLEDQIHHFKEAIKIRGILCELKPIKELVFSQFKKQSFNVEEANRDLFDEMMEICYDMDILVDKVFFKLPEHRFENEYDKAVFALKNAEVTAGFLANHLGLQVTKILNIDDDTRFTDPLMKGMSQERIQALLELLESFGGSVNSNESKRPFKDGTYNLWVTFLLSPK